MPGKLFESKIFTVFLPQLLFLGLWISYLLAGATVFMRLERPWEKKLKTDGIKVCRQDLQRLEEIALQLANFPKQDVKATLKQMDQARMEFQIGLRRLLAKWDHSTILPLYLHGTSRDRPDTLSSSMLFAFPLLTTIGYGVVTPSTVVGRIFCIGYSTLGIPLMMITIANIGKFVSLVIVAATRVALRMGRRLNSSLPGRVKVPIEIVVTDIDTNDIPDEEQKLSLTGLAIASLFTLIVGTMTVWHYENLDFFPSLYFCFISLTTVGLGDIYPRNMAMLPVTLLLLSVGLAVMTLAIQFVAAGFRRIHYLGRKISGSPKCRTWFGGRILSVGEIIAAVGEQLHIPKEKIAVVTENLDDMIEKLMTEKDKDKVKDRRKSLRPLDTSPVTPSISEEKWLLPN